METTILNATEYRNVSLSLLNESKTNPRRIFEDAALKELADSIRSQGVLSPLLVRPLTEKSFEIVAGARRFRAAQIAEVPTVPVRIVNLSDAEALEAQLIENLQRRDVHPLEEAQGFRALLNLDEPKYSVEQIAAKTGKSPPMSPPASNSPNCPQPWSRHFTPRKSVSGTLSCWQSFSPTSSNPLSPLASGRTGKVVAANRSVSSYPSAIFSSKLTAISFSSSKTRPLTRRTAN